MSSYKKYTLKDLRSVKGPLMYITTRESKKHDFKAKTVFRRFTFNVNGDLVLIPEDFYNRVIPRSMIDRYGFFVSASGTKPVKQVAVKLPTTNEGWANYLTKYLNLGRDDSDDLLHDLNNLRGGEWVDVLAEQGVSKEVLNAFKKYVNACD